MTPQLCLLKSKCTIQDKKWVLQITVGIPKLFEDFHFSRIPLPNHGLMTMEPIGHISFQKEQNFLIRGPCENKLNELKIGSWNSDNNKIEQNIIYSENSLYQVDCASVIREQYRQVTLQAVPRGAHSPRAKLTNIDDVDPELYVQPICPGVTKESESYWRRKYKYGFVSLLQFKVLNTQSIIMTDA